MREPAPSERSNAVEPWWYQDGEPEYIALPEAGGDAAATWRHELADVRAGTSAFAAEMRTALSALTEAVDALRAEGAEARRDLGAAVERARAEAASQTAALRAGLGEFETSLSRAVADAVTDVGGALRESAGAVQTSIEKASLAMTEDHASTMDRYAKEFAIAVAPLEQGLARIERLASVIEAMGKRRGFQKLVKTETALQEEQSALVRTLADAGADVGARVAAIAERMEQLEERLEQATRDAEALRQVPAQASERVSAAVERARGELTAALQDRFRDEVRISIDRLQAGLEAGVPVREAIGRLREMAGTQSDLAGVQRSIDGVVASLRAEVQSLSDRIQSWGKPRTAPRLARELDELGGRLDALEQDLRDGFVERVAGTVTENVMAALAKPESKRRGLFRRSRR